MDRHFYANSWFGSQELDVHSFSGITLAVKNPQYSVQFFSRHHILVMAMLLDTYPSKNYTLAKLLIVYFSYCIRSFLSDEKMLRFL